MADLPGVGPQQQLRLVHARRQLLLRQGLDDLMVQRDLMTKYGGEDYGESDGSYDHGSADHGESNGSADHGVTVDRSNDYGSIGGDADTVRFE